MNLYLSTCHALALLESPQTLAEFQSSARLNLLFQSGCTSVGQCLWFLADEGILTFEQDRFHLSEMGGLLYKHLLDWTQRDKEKIKQQKQTQLETAPEEIVSPLCPACQQKNCAIYIFSILIERLYSGLSTRKQWQPGEADLILKTLAHYAFNQAETQQELWLLAECHPYAAWLETEQNQLKLALSQCQAKPSDSDTETILSQFSQPHILKPLPGLDFSVNWVSRLQLDYGLLAAKSLKTVRALANPFLYQTFESQETIPGNQLFLRLARPALSQDQSQAYLPLKVNAELHLLIWERQTEQKWQLRQFLNLSQESPSAGLNDHNTDLTQSD